jgi:hypothetical protein
MKLILIARVECIQGTDLTSPPHWAATAGGGGGEGGTKEEQRRRTGTNDRERVG